MTASTEAGRPARPLACEMPLRAERPRLLPQRPFPPYAYLPGRMPHPIRDQAGHSFGHEAEPVTEPALESDEFRWGVDLFNHGFYWEAHEAWEALWRAAERGDPRRSLLKGLILLAAAGVKVREGKPAATARHAARAVALLQTTRTAAPHLASALGVSLDEIERCVETALAEPGRRLPAMATPEPVFPFILQVPEL